MASVDFTSSFATVRIKYTHDYSNGSKTSTFQITDVCFLASSRVGDNWYVDGKITVNGTVVKQSSMSNTQIWKYVGATDKEVSLGITSGAFTINHDANGNGSITVALESNTRSGFIIWAPDSNNSANVSGSKTLSFNVPQSYSLSISKGIGSTISVNRTSSSVGGTGILSNGATLWSGDRITISFGAEPGYTLNTHTVDGSNFTSGGSKTISGNVSVAATATPKQYTLSLSCGSGADVSVADASGTLYINGSSVQYGKSLTLIATATAGYKIKSITIDGTQSSDNPVTFTVRDNIDIVIQTGVAGSVYIDTPNGFASHQVYIFTKDGWNLYVPYLFTRKGWGMCVGDDSGGSSSGGSNAPLEISIDPVSISILENRTAEFQVVATGNRITYQWQKNSKAIDGNDSWTDITNAKSDILSLTAAYSLNGYQYRCMITDDYGYSQATKAATLTVLRKSVELCINSHPSGGTWNVNDAVNFVVSANGEDIVYQWQVNQYSTTGVDSWTNISGANSSTYSRTAVRNQSGWKYRCAVADKYGDIIISNAAIMTVIVPLAITSNPTDTTVTKGNTYSFSVSAVGESVTYQWKVKRSGSNTWSNLSGKTSANLSAVATSEDDGSSFQCTVSDNLGNTLLSSVVKLTVIIPLVIITQPSSVNADVGDTYRVSIVVDGKSVRYQWQVKKSTNWENITGATNNYYESSMTEGTDGWKYRCVLSDFYGNNLTSNEATITLYTDLVIITQPSNSFTKLGNNYSFTVIAGGRGISYQWEVNMESYTGASSWSKIDGNGNTYTSIASNYSKNGWRYRCVLSDMFGNSATTNEVTLTIPFITITEQPVSTSAQTDSGYSFSVNATGYGIHYQWQVNHALSTGGSWSNISGATSRVLTGTASQSQDGWSYRCYITDDYDNSAVSNEVSLSVISFRFSIDSVGTTYGFSLNTSTGYYVPENSQIHSTFAIARVNFVCAIDTSISVSIRHQGESGCDWGCIGNIDSVLNRSTSVDSSVLWDGKQYGATLTETVIETTIPSGEHFFEVKYRKDSSKSVGIDSIQFRIITPQITQQPVDAIVNPGNQFVFATSAFGCYPVTYQWQLNRVEISGTDSWVDISGATSSSYSGTMQTSNNYLKYRCLISDGSGFSVYTNEVSSIIPFISISKQPESISAVVGVPYTLAVEVFGYNLSYQWQVNGVYRNGIDQWNSVTGEISNEYQFVMSSSIANNQYRCKIYDTFGNTAYTNVVTISKTSFKSSVSSIDGVTYSFALNDEGYYASQNTGIRSTFAICRMNFECESDTLLYLSIRHQGEGSCDWGCIGNFDTELNRSITEDSSVLWNGKTYNATLFDGDISITVPAGRHFAEVKYRKDNSKDVGIDSMQFKIPGVKFTTNPNDVACDSGDTFTLYASATGVGNISYIWQINKESTTGVYLWEYIDGSNSNQYSEVFIDSHDGWKYRCVAEDIRGYWMFSDTAIITKNTFSYSVENVSGATYGFTLRSDGYYESTNAGINSSYSLCRVTFSAGKDTPIYIRTHNWAEAQCDYGIISQWDTALSLSISDSNCSWSGQSSAYNEDFPVAREYTVPAGTHFLDIKYRKDGSVHKNNDSLRFKIEMR